MTTAVFLDRDGTLIVEREYLSDPAGVSLESGAIEGLSALRNAGHPLIVVSNQSGIGRGLYTRRDAERVNERAAALLAVHRIDILAWYICPHAPDAGCTCRKPAPGLALQASREWGIELSDSHVIGDKWSDIELADAIGAKGILVTTGYGGNAAERARREGRPVRADLAGAAALIRGGTGS